LYIANKKIQQGILVGLQLESIIEILESMNIKIVEGIGTKNILMACEFKSKGGLSHYDAILMAIAQSSILITKDQEFQQFQDKFEVIILS
jgi:predicted nucleic acid-binding protein